MLWPLRSRRAEPPTDRGGRTLANALPDRTIRCTSPLAEAFGGRLPITGTILVTGPPKGGKSTQVARAVLELTARGWPTLLCDGEMTEGLARETWSRSLEKGDALTLDRVTRYHVRTIADVHRAVARARPRVVVLDSLHSVAQRASERVEALKSICLEPRQLWVIVGQAREDGQVSGGNPLKHWPDGLAMVRRDGIVMLGRRWASGD